MFTHLSFAAKKSGVNQVSFMFILVIWRLYGFKVSHFVHINDLLSTGTQLFKLIYDISFDFSNNFTTTTTFPLF